MEHKKRQTRALSDVATARDPELCAAFGINQSTLDSWRADPNVKFPQPVFVRRGSPRLTRLVEVQRWWDSRAARRHKPIKRGRLKQQEGTKDG